MKRSCLSYRILIKNSTNDLEDEVNKLLEDNWELQGGVTAYLRTNTLYLSQAMTKIIK